MNNRFSMLYALNLKERIIVVFVTSVSFIFFIYVFSISPAISKYKTATRVLDVQKKLIKAREKKKERAIFLEKSFNDLEAVLLERKKNFFSNKQAMVFLENLETISDETGNKLEKMKFKVAKLICNSLYEQEMYYKVNIVEVFVTCNYNSLLMLFERFSNYDKLVSVSEINLEGTKDNTLLLNAQFVLNLYVFDK